MTNIDPTRINGAEWKKWMEDADKAEGNDKKDGVFLNSAFERDYVEKQAKAAGKTEEEISAFFASAKPNEKSTTEIMGGEFSISKKAEKAKKENILTHIKNDNKANPANLNWDNVVKNLNDVFVSQTVDSPEYYKKLMAEVTVVANAVKAYTAQNPVNNRSDVEKIYDNVKKQLNLNKKDEFKDFKLDVLKEFVELAEASQKAKETKLVREAYYDLMTKGVDGKKLTKKEAIHEVKKKFKGSYFNDVIKDFEKGTVKTQANEEFLDAIDEFGGMNQNITNSRKLRKEAKKSMDDSSYVKISNESLKDRLKGKTSTNKAYSKTEIIDNRANVRKTEAYSRDDFYKTLKNDKIFERMVYSDANLLTPVKAENGETKYNLTNLSDMIRNRVGADLRASTQGKDLYPYDEVENIVKDIAVKTGLGDVSSADARHLIKMCGFEIIGKNWVKITTDALKQTAISTLGASAGIAVMMASMLSCISSIENNTYKAIYNFEGDIPVTVDVDKSLNVTLNIELGENAQYTKFDKRAFYMGLDQSLWDSIKFKETGTGYQIIIDHKVLEHSESAFKLEDLLSLEERTKEYTGKELGINGDVNKAKELAKSIGISAASQLAINMLIGALTAEREHETPIINTQVEQKSLEEYEKYIDADKRLSTAEKHAIKQLARAYIEKDPETLVEKKDANGNYIWKRAEYEKFLEDIAGPQSFLSRDELLRGLRKHAKAQTTTAPNTPAKPAEQVTPQDPTKTTPATDPTKQKKDPVTPKVEIDAEEVPQEEKQLEPNYHLGNKHTWKGLAALYGAETQAEIKDVYTELKRVNGIRPGDNVIPQDLYLPETLGNRTKRTFTDNEAQENFIKRNDQKITKHDPVISNGTKLGTVKQGSKWKGTKTVNGEKKETAPIYNTEADAKKAAKDL